MAMPRCTGGRSLTTLPPISISPALTSSRPAIMRSRVDLPQPEGPTKTTNSPSETSRSMPLMMRASAKDFSRRLRLNCDMIASPAGRGEKGWPPPLRATARSGRNLLVLLEFGSGLFQGSLGLRLAGHDRLDHFDHDILQTDIVGEQRLGTTELDAVEERLPVGLLGDQIGRSGFERTQRGQALGHFGIPLALAIGQELGEADGLVFNAGALEDGERIGDQQRAGTLGIRAE